MLAQFESHYIHLNCLQTRLKVISAGRLESLQRSFLIWGPKAVMAQEKKNLRPKPRVHLHWLQVTLKSKAKHNKIPAILSLSPAAESIHCASPTHGVKSQAHGYSPDLSTLGALCFFIAIKGTLKENRDWKHELSESVSLSQLPGSPLH